ncbi:MAG: hypothetical protein ACYDH9_10065 [Limisphaerales bacterium]
MSLINDALKRASQSQKERAQTTPPPASPPLQPVEHAPPAGPPRYLVPVLVVLVLGLSGWAFWKWSEVGQSPALATSSKLASTTPGRMEAASPATHRLNSSTEIQVNTNPVVRPSPPPAAVTPPPSTPIQTAPTAVATPAPAPVPDTNTATAAAETAPAKRSFPELKLQGIFYRLRNPSVMINNLTLYKGDAVEGARVLAIEREGVTVEFDGQKKRLLMH